MKNISFIIITAAFVALSSCAKNDIGEELLPMTAQSDIAALMLDDVDSTAAYEHYLLRLDAGADGDYRLSDEAITESLLRFCNPDNQAKTADISEKPALTIKGIRPLNEPVALRSASDPRAAVPPVVVEFTSEQGDGYAVCSGDVRYQKIFSYVPSGSLDDTVNIKVLSLFYRSVSHSINDSIARFNSRVSTLQALWVDPDMPDIEISMPNPKFHPNHQDHIKNPLPEGMYCMGEEYITNTTEKTLGMKIKWDQYAPYNNAMPNVSGCLVDKTNNKPVVGCVPVALGQALAYKKNKYFKYIAPHWDAINNYSTIKGTQYEDVVAKFLRELADGVKVSYTPNGTASTFEKLQNYLKAVNDASSYNILCQIIEPNTLNDTNEKYKFYSEEIGNKNPVVIIANNWDKKFGHAFVVDGTKHISKDLYEVIGTVYGGNINKMYRYLCSESETYLSINWGWQGDSDGYYDIDNFAVKNYKFNILNAIIVLK